jgi:hypothetical protein
LLAFDYADGVLDSDYLPLYVSVLCEQLQALTADSALPFVTGSTTPSGRQAAAVRGLQHR